MSRIGNKAVAIPSGVTANVDGQTVKMKGPKGALQAVLHDDVVIKLDKGAVTVAPRETSARAPCGTSRTLVANLIAGVTKGFEERWDHWRRLSRRGAGQACSCARLQPRRESRSRRHRHRDPEADRNRDHGIDKQKVGHVAAEIRGYRPPEPYKGKGVKYTGEYIFRKEGKKK